jgi:hypothetical protein
MIAFGGINIRALVWMTPSPQFGFFWLPRRPRAFEAFPAPASLLIKANVMIE